MHQSISGSGRREANVPSTTVVSRPGSAAACTDATVDAGRAITWPWVLATVAEVVQPRRAVPSPAPLKALPAEIHRFVTEVARLPEVRCVVIEDIGKEGDDTLHVTTFAGPVSPSVRDAVYDAEMDAIDASPSLRFDFHLRRADEVDGGTPSAKHVFAIWGDLGGESR
jgi:hypothetical protein